MHDAFISERIEPSAGGFEGGAMTPGEPILPASFTWRDRVITVCRVLESWKETASCKSGGNERYVRKHWYRILIDSGEEMRLYFERQPRSRSQSRARWWLFSVTRPVE